MPLTLIKDYNNRNGNRKIIENLQICTWNIKTLFKLGTQKKIIDGIAKYNLQFVVLQEMRQSNSDSIKYKETIIF